MRTTADRIRQAVSFELIGLLTVTPIFSGVFGHPVEMMGALAIMGSTIATVWNYLFNLGFDHLLRWKRGSVDKTLPIRVTHAVLFEATLLVILLPLIAWWLSIPVLEAALMDLSFAAYYLVYMFVFTWVYDWLFPPQGRESLET